LSPELKPEMGSTFADPPAAGFFVDDPETVPKGGVRLALANLGSKSGPSSPTSTDAVLSAPAGA
jgi:hypothetical protein